VLWSQQKVRPCASPLLWHSHPVPSLKCCMYTGGRLLKHNVTTPEVWSPISSSITSFHPSKNGLRHCTDFNCHKHKTNYRHLQQTALSVCHPVTTRNNTVYTMPWSYDGTGTHVAWFKTTDVSEPDPVFVITVLIQEYRRSLVWKTSVQPKNLIRLSVTKDPVQQ